MSTKKPTADVTAITDFLESGGYGYRREGDAIILTGEWIHEWPSFRLDADATVERLGGGVYQVRDSSGVYRLEVFDGSGANGEITEVR